MNTKRQYRWGCSKPDGGLTLISPIFDDFDACYDDYTESMGALKSRGTDLSTMQWRGVYSLDQLALMIMGRSVYLDKITVERIEE